MHKGYLIGSVILFVVSIGCVATVVVKTAQGEYGMGSLNCWGSIACHAVTAVVAAFLLDKAHGEKEQTEKEERS